MTFDSKNKVARAMVVTDGRIAEVGDDAEVKRSVPRGCDRYDLGGRVVIPGFIDCHTHFIQMGIDALNVNLSGAMSLNDALAMIRGAARTTPEGEWVISANWKESGWSDGRFITRQDLDSCCPNNPAVAHRVCGHLSTVNSRGLALLEIDSKIPDVDLNKGILKEDAVGIIRSATAPSWKQKIGALKVATRMAHALGVTSVNDNGGTDDFKVYMDAEKRDRLGVRVWFNSPSQVEDSRIRLGISTGLGSEWLKMGGVKIFCDGALGARTAALSREYADDPGNKGKLVREKSELESIVQKAHIADIQVAVHAIGDLGISAALSALARAQDSDRSKQLRHRIEHLELPSNQHLRTMHELRVIASMQPNFVGEWGGTDGMYRARLGSERTAMNNPFRKALEARVKLVFGSDCMPFSPLYGIHSAVNAPYESQRISPYEALAAYTRDAAYASFGETQKGKLSKGNLADFAVLSRDPLAEPGEIRSLHVTETVLGGQVVYERAKRKTGAHRRAG